MISVIIITNNRQKEILQVLEFLNAQTYKEFEVIIIDNGSKINLKKKEKLANYNYKLKYFYYKNILGRSEARNTGAYYAEGDILLFLDDTILLEKTTLRFVYSFFKKHKQGVLLFPHYEKYSFPQQYIANNEIILQKLKAIKYLSNKSTIRDNVFQATLFFCINKYDFIDIGKFDLIFGHRYGFEDWEFTYRAIKKRYAIYQENIIYIHNYHKKYKNDGLNSKGFYINFGLFLLKHPELITIEYLNNIKNPYYMYSKNEISDVIFGRKDIEPAQLNKNQYIIDKNGKMILRYI